MGSMWDAFDSITTPNYMKEVVDETIFSTVVLDILRKKGNIKTVKGGDTLNWPVKAGHFTVFNSEIDADYADRATPANRHFQPYLSPGQVSVMTRLSKDAMKMHRGEYALDDLRKSTIPDLVKDLLYAGKDGAGTQKSLMYDFFNGTGTGTNPVYGLGLFSAQATTGCSTRAGVVASGTYAGYSIVASAVGAALANGESDAWTPKLICVGTAYTGWTDGTDIGFQKDTAIEVLEACQSATCFNPRDIKEQADVAFLSTAAYDILRGALTAIAQINIDKPTDKGDNEWGVGSSIKRLNVSGFPVYREALLGTGASTYKGWVLNLDKIMLNCWAAEVGQLDIPGSAFSKRFESYGMALDLVVDYNIGRNAFVMRADLMGQFTISPRHQCYFGDF